MNLYGLKQLIDSIRTVRKNTIQIAEDVPEEQYGYGPGLLTVSHAPNGFVPIRNVAQCALVYALTAVEMLSQ